MSNAVVTDWPSGSANTGWPQEPTGMLMPGMVQGWPAGTQRASNAAQRLLSQAVAWWDVEQYRDGDRFLRNRGTGGELLDLRLGSSIVANTNDPKWLGPEDSGYVYLPGVAGNYLSVPDENALDITGDIDIRCRVALDNWSSVASTTALVSKRNAATNQRGYALLFGSGTLILRLSGDGTTETDATSSANVAAANGDVLDVRATWRASDGRVQFFTSTDGGANWTQLGSDRTTAIASIYANTAVLEIGASSAGTGFATAGKFYRAQVLSGIDGTTVLDIDCNNITTGSQTSWTDVYQTVTVNRSTSGRKSVAVPSRHKGGKPVMLLGTDDYLTEGTGYFGRMLRIIPSSQNRTFMWVGRMPSTVSDGPLFTAKFSGGSTFGGWGLYGSTGTRYFEINTDINGTFDYRTVNAGSGLAVGQVNTLAVVIGEAGMTLWTNGVLSATTSYRRGTDLRITYTISITSDNEFYAAVADRRAWSASQIKAAADYYTGRIA